MKPYEQISSSRASLSDQHALGVLSKYGFNAILKHTLLLRITSKTCINMRTIFPLVRGGGGVELYLKMKTIRNCRDLERLFSFL